MKKEYNPWKDLFGYSDMDLDGDVDLDDVYLEDQLEKQLANSPKTTSYYDIFSDGDDEEEDDDLGIDDSADEDDDYLGIGVLDDDNDDDYLNEDSDDWDDASDDDW